MADFVDMWPDNFLNITNGITPRRFLLLCNPDLSHLISSKIGDQWIKNLKPSSKTWKPLQKIRSFKPIGNK